MRTDRADPVERASLERGVRFGEPTRVMGIVNVTPDSFYDGGRYAGVEEAVRHGLRLAEEGADILDVGGESTRPGAAPVSAAEEIRRVVPVIEQLAGRTGLPVSVDTRKAEVARRALEAGASWINDVSAGCFDPEILALAAETGAPYVAMHMRGTPETMQADTLYEDLIGEMLRFFEDRIAACEAAGLRREQLVLDPGIGFGKSREANYTLLARLGEFRRWKLPLLVGPSRKSFLLLAGAEEAEDRLAGTLAAVTACVLAGVEVVRVHDVAETVQAVRVALRIREKKP